MKVILALVTMFMFGFALFSSAFADHRSGNTKTYVQLDS